MTEQQLQQATKDTIQGLQTLDKYLSENTHSRKCIHELIQQLNRMQLADQWKLFDETDGSLYMVRNRQILHLLGQLNNQISELEKLIFHSFVSPDPDEEMYEMKAYSYDQRIFRDLAGYAYAFADVVDYHRLLMATTHQ